MNTHSSCCVTNFCPILCCDRSTLLLHSHTPHPFCRKNELQLTRMILFNAYTQTYLDAQLACTLMLPGPSLLPFPAAMCAGLERCLLHLERSTAVRIAAAARILLVHLCSYLCNTCRGSSLGLLAQQA